MPKINNQPVGANSPSQVTLFDTQTCVARSKGDHALGAALLPACFIATNFGQISLICPIVLLKSGQQAKNW
jgi:hypothetical protein